MKKLYHHTKGKIHPSPPPSQPPQTTTTTTTTTDHHLSLLPIAIATLAATLPPHDQQVLAYLLSISTTNTTAKPTTKPSSEHHAPQFNCNCFTCYTTFWVRWDSSPNRKVIHEIIDAYEDKLLHNKKHSKSKKERKNNNNNNINKKCLSLSSSSSAASSAAAADVITSCSSGLHAPVTVTENEKEGPLDNEQSKMDGGDEGSSEKGSVRKIVNFIGERIWGVWGV